MLLVLLPVSEKKHSFRVSPCLAIPKQKLLASPDLLLRKPIFLIVLFFGGVFFYRHRYLGARMGTQGYLCAVRPIHAVKVQSGKHPESRNSGTRKLSLERFEPWLQGSGLAYFYYYYYL